MGHNHNHNHGHSPQDGLTLAFWLNLIFSIIEAAGGVITNSSAIVADAFHDFMDAIAIGMAVLFEKISVRKRSSKFSYGYKRFSLLSAVGLSVFLLTGAILMVINAIKSLLHPAAVNSTGMIWLALLGLAVNGIAFLKIKKATKHKNQTGCQHGHNSKAVMLHLLEDVLGWIAVLLGAAIIHFTGLYWIDPLMAIGIAIFISYNSFRNLMATMKIMLQGLPDNVQVDILTKELENINGIKGIHDLHIWSLDGNYNIATLHVVLQNKADIQGNSIYTAVIRLMEKHNIQHPTVQIETSEGGCMLINC